MYVVTPYPNVLYAFDLSQPDYPLKWEYRPAGGCQRAWGSLLRRDQPGRDLRRRQAGVEPAREVSTGVRALVLPSVRSELLWVLPVVVGGRIYLNR